MPADVELHGDIFGGWIMSQVDIAGGVLAARRARGRVATVAVNSFVFKQPVLIGDVVSFFAEITRIGRTSITVDVEVYAQRNPSEDESRCKVTEASLTYVAVGADRRPREIRGRRDAAQSTARLQCVPARLPPRIARPRRIVDAVDAAPVYSDSTHRDAHADRRRQATAERAYQQEENDP